MRSGINATPEQKNGVVVRQVVGQWSPGRGARLSATRRIVSRVTLVCELFSTEGVAGD